jgi:hypothetical protein
MPRKRKLTPNQKAALWLKRICKLTGAKPCEPLDGSKSYKVRVGKVTFQASAFQVRLDCPYRQTCFNFGYTELPTSEKIASVLLWLKAYPKEFDRWAARGVFNKKNLK